MKLKLLLAALALCATWTAEAKKVTPARGQAARATTGVKTKAAAKPAAPAETAFRKTPYVGAMAVDAETGRVLFAANENAKAYPASCTKLMTLLLVLEDVRAGKIGLDELVEATPAVNRCIPSWVGIRVGETMSVRDLCLALMVESANDAALVLAVKCAGSVDGFVARMNSRAAALGMASTQFYNPNGLPAPKFGKHFNVSTAADLVKLGRAVAKIPAVYEFTSVKTCDLVKRPGGYRVSVTRKTNEPQRATQLAEGESIVKQLRNHNNVMRIDKLKIFNADGTEAVDGLKTGYIDAGGSSVVLSGRRNGRHVIVVVLGSATAKLRDEAARRLMTDALGALGN